MSVNLPNSRVEHRSPIVSFLLMLLNIFNPNRNIYDIKRDKIWGLEIFLRYLF